MEKFVVSARKYRPQTFTTVVGQSHITTTLKNAIKTEHLAQAFLFCGPRGVGKTSCARILAKTINCHNSSETQEPCHECTSCKNFEQNASFNIHELDAASNNSVEDIRNLIEQVRFPPQDGKYKVYIIDEVHMLSQAAFNAFLKTLEEPPSYAIFILATTEKHKILPTILSRCQTFDFNRIKIKDMADHLADIAGKEGIEAEREALELIAQKADGGLRDALSMFDLNVTFSENNELKVAQVLANLHVLDYDYYFKAVSAILSADTGQLLVLLNEILENGFDPHLFISGLNEHFRNLLVCQDPRTIELLEVIDSVKVKFQEQAKAASPEMLLSLLSIGSQIDISFKAARNKRLHVEIGLIKMAQLKHVFSTDFSIESEKKNSEPNLKAVIPSEAPGRETPTAETNVVATSKVEPLPKKKKKLKSTFDLEKKVDTPVVPIVTQAMAHEKTTETSEASLKSLIKKFSENKEMTSQKMMLESNFELDGQKSLTFMVQNSLQFDLFEEMKQEITDFLRGSLNNSTLELDCQVITKELKAKPRTEQEKYQSMIEKNPALTQLKEGLDLDLNY